MDQSRKDELVLRVGEMFYATIPDSKIDRISPRVVARMAEEMVNEVLIDAILGEIPASHIQAKVMQKVSSLLPDD